MGKGVPAAPSGHSSKTEPCSTVSAVPVSVPNADDDPAYKLPLPPGWALDEAAKLSGFGDWFQVPAWLRTPGNRAVIVNARLLALQAISAWPERRPKLSESKRSETAEYFAGHLPKAERGRAIDDADLNAMRAAFIRRFGEQLPRTETLMAVANVGYRMALRDLASAGEAGTATTVQQGVVHEHATAEGGDAQKGSANV